MKAVWEESDIRGGARAKKPGTMGRGNIIAYSPGVKDEPRWGLVSLDDGCIIYSGCTQKFIADCLTENGDVPICMLDASDEARAA